MELHSKIIKEKGLFVQKYVGDFSVEEYKSAAIKTIKSPEWKYVNKSLADFREATVINNFEILDELVKFRATINIQNILTVYLVNSPMATALAHLYIDNLKKSCYYYCTTMNKALSILESDMSEREMEYILKNLKENRPDIFL